MGLGRGKRGADALEKCNRDDEATIESPMTYERSKSGRETRYETRETILVALRSNPWNFSNRYRVAFEMNCMNIAMYFPDRSTRRNRASRRCFTIILRRTNTRGLLRSSWLSYDDSRDLIREVSPKESHALARPDKTSPFYHISLIEVDQGLTFSFSELSARARRCHGSSGLRARLRPDSQISADLPGRTSSGSMTVVRSSALLSCFANEIAARTRVRFSCPVDFTRRESTPARTTSPR